MQAADLITLAENLEAAKEKMEHLANHDALTGLPSLRLCNERLESALAIDRRNKSQTAVLFIDLDRLLSVLLRRTDKIIELSRAALTVPRYGESNRLVGVD